MPDLLLMPARSPRGEADLMALLKNIPGGIRTLTLPPVEKADPVDLARQIREMLAATHTRPSPRTAGAKSTSPYLLAAAHAAIAWARVRQAEWANDSAPLTLPAPAQPPTRSASVEPDEPARLVDVPTPASVTFGAIDSGSPGMRERTTEWLPRAAAFAAVIGLATAGAMYLPQLWGDGGDGPAPDAGMTAPPAAERAEPRTRVPPATSRAEPRPTDAAAGWIAVFAPFEVSVSENGQGLRLDDRGRTMVAPGQHRLRFQNRDLGYDETRTVEVESTATITINLTPATTIAVTSSEPAEVLVDGASVGATPYEGTIPLGTHSVTVRAAGAERQIPLTATSAPVRLEVDFSKP